MPSLGITKAQAVDEILIAITEEPYNGSGMATGTWPNLTYSANINGQVERWLDLVLRQIQSAGTPHNVTRCRKFTAASNLITLPADTLHVVGAGPDAHRSFSLVDDLLYDNDNGTTTFTTGTEVFLDWYRLIEFNKCPPALKHKIVADATVYVHMRYRKDPQMHAMLQDWASRFSQPAGPLSANMPSPGATLATFAPTASVPAPAGPARG